MKLNREKIKKTRKEICLALKQTHKFNGSSKNDNNKNRWQTATHFQAKFSEKSRKTLNSMIFLACNRRLLFVLQTYRWIYVFSAPFLNNSDNEIYFQICSASTVDPNHLSITRIESKWTSICRSCRSSRALICSWCQNCVCVMMEEQIPSNAIVNYVQRKRAMAKAPGVCVRVWKKIIRFVRTACITVHVWRVYGQLSGAQQCWMLQTTTTTLAMIGIANRLTRTKKCALFFSSFILALFYLHRFTIVKKWDESGWQMWLEHIFWSFYFVYARACYLKRQTVVWATKITANNACSASLEVSHLLSKDRK